MHRRSALDGLDRHGHDPTEPDRHPELSRGGKRGRPARHPLSKDRPHARVRRARHREHGGRRKLSVRPGSAGNEQRLLRPRRRRPQPAREREGGPAGDDQRSGRRRAAAHRRDSRGARQQRQRQRGHVHRHRQPDGRRRERQPAAGIPPRRVAPDRRRRTSRRRRRLFDRARLLAARPGEHPRRRALSRPRADQRLGAGLLPDHPRAAQPAEHPGIRRPARLRAIADDQPARSPERPTRR